MDENLKGVGDLVKEALGESGDTSIKEGVQAPVVDTPVVETPVPPTKEVIPQEGIQSPEVPGGQQPPIGGAGDKVAEQTPVTPVVDPVAPVAPVVDPELAQKLSDYEALKISNAALKDQYADASTKLNQKLDPWANQEIAELNSFVKETGINDSGLFNKLKGADLANMDSKQVLEIQMQKDNPNLSQREVQEYISDNYNLDKQDYSSIIDDDDRKLKEDAQERAIRRGETNMKIDANKARTELVGLQEKIKPVDLKGEMAINQKAHEEKVQGMTEDWNPHITKSVEELRQFPIEIPGEDGQSQKLATFEVPADKLAVYKNQAMQFAINNGIEASSLENQQAVNQFMANMIVIDYKDQIIQKAINATRSSMELEVEREISNPTGKNLPATPDQTPVIDKTPKTAQDHEEEAFAAADKQIMSGDY